MKVAISLLVLCALGLAVALFLRHTKAVETEKTQLNTIVTISKQLEETRNSLDEEQKLNRLLTNEITLRLNDLKEASNSLNRTQTELATTRQAAAAAAETAKVEMAKRDQRISELQNQGDELRKKMDDLTLNIEGLNKAIAETEKKLAASEGDREFLLKELKRLQTEKAELEKQFNDLATLRSQVAKLKEELSIARRLEWIRMGIYGNQDKKGAEILLSSPASTTKPSYNLNVELKQDGTATVVPPVTNAPAPK